MGDSEHCRGDADAEDAFPASVTGVGEPVLLAATVPELGRGDVLAGRYQIEAVIGTGGSGRVMRAFDRVTRELVALKILRPEYVADPVWTERFSRELRVGRQIQHPNVCRVFDIGESDGYRYLSMELATGGTLRKQSDGTAKKRPFEDRVADARAIIDGVTALHAAGIVHRDLKPENILRMADGRLVVTDFGLATDPGTGPATTIMIGTPRYMAPEVVMGDPADTRADVWALGIVLHEILFGCRPDRSVVNRGRRKFTPPPAFSPRESRLAELCGHCSDDDPNRRPKAAGEVVREFQFALLGKRLRKDRRGGQIAWAAVGLAAVITLGVVRSQWTNRAVASSVGSIDSLTARVLQPSGMPQDWSRDSKRLAALEGPVHCFSLNRDGRSAQVVWGQPRRVENVDIASGARSLSPLLADAAAEGCPNTSPDGKSLLFERIVDGAGQIFFAANPEGRGGKQVVRGSAPRWLPNGQEFSFTLDSRHAAIFSIPTREMTVVTDNLSGLFTIDAHASNSIGNRLAVLYTTESFGSVLVVHALPSLGIIGRSQVPAWARGLRFDSKGDVQFTVVDPSGLRQVVATNEGVTTLRNVARLPTADVQDAFEFDGGTLVVARKRRVDLWRRDQTDHASRLTVDGRSLNGSRSPSGALVIQRMLADAREVIVLRDEQGNEKTVTSGPNDLTPSFLPDGSAWLYVRLNSGEIIRCERTTERCASIHADSLIPAYPMADPSGTRVAYITSLNASRVRVASLVRREAPLDLGPAIACGPVWTSAEHLWAVISAPANKRVWAEIDANSGRRTGRIRSIAMEEGGDQCPPPIAFSGAKTGQDRVYPVLTDRADIVRTDVPAHLADSLY